MTTTQITSASFNESAWILKTQEVKGETDITVITADNELLF